MATVTLLEKARQGRLDALANRGPRKASRYDDNLVSIFDFAFDADAEDKMLSADDKVIAFRSTRTALVAANDTAAPDRIAA